MLHSAKRNAVSKKLHPSTTTDNIKYLDISISTKLSELFYLYNNPLLKSIEEDLNIWNDLPISLFGRIASVKMTIQPK